MFTARRLVSKCINGIGTRSKHQLPELDYEYNALEPVISRDIMALHHSKHHQTYVNGLNAAEEKMAQAVTNGDVATQIQLQAAIKFNGGGHLNHSIFWKNLTPSSTVPTADLQQRISGDFGSLDNMKKLLSEKTVAIQGSGWGWLVYNRESKGLRVITCPNQDPVTQNASDVPLLGIDVWEHAYYLQYKNVRADYVRAIFDVINWEDVSRRLAAARG